MNDGWGPKKTRPMNVAVPVARATGKNVRTLTSGIISSIANKTPPIGVLKVAAMPLPAPAATRMIRSPWDIRTIMAQGRSEGRSDLDDRTLASDGSAAANRDCGGQ